MRFENWYEVCIYSIKFVCKQNYLYLCTNKRKKYREKDKEEWEEHRTDAYR